MEILVIAVLIGLVPASIAHSKGRSFGTWWFYGAALFIVALPHSIIIRPNSQELEKLQLSDGMKKCPACAELIKAEAKICRYCHHTQPEIIQSDAQLDEKAAMRQYGISLKGSIYTIGGYDYDTLQEAVNHAKSVNS
ncbi:MULTISPECIES: hypothetical protein [unclassified Duganella]|uniref:hypothetical protein n=1 Tax=unclassified Duganella TaxID=2636909 RepID=UPI0018F39FCD|nr:MULTISPECIES: hypothetical protein [unclassified Duganella]